MIIKSTEISSINLKDGGTREKRTVTIADETTYSIDVTVWGELAENEFETGKIVAFKGARISEFSGKSLNASSDKSDLVFDLEHPEALKVKSWYKKDSKSADLIKPLSGGS